MVQDVRRIKEQLAKDNRITIEGLDNLDSLAREAYEKPWWRSLIKTIEMRRMAFLNELVSTQQEQRAEDMMRGRIQELTFILAVDENAKRLFNEKETGNGSA